MKKNYKKISHFVEYILLILIEKFMNILPRNIALFCGSFLGKVLYRCGAYRKIVRKNMEFVGLWNCKEMKTITRNLYSNMGKYVVDFLRLSRPPFEIHNKELFDIAHSNKKGTMILLAHFGNWEMLAGIYGEIYPNEVHVVAKKMKNPRAEFWLTKKRENSSVIVIYTEHALRRIYSALRKNGIVAMLIDQHASKHGTMVPFLGKEANTVRAMAGMVARTGCNVLSIYSLINKNNNYDIFLNNIPDVVTNENMSEDEIIFEYQKTHNDVISGWVREHPDHWFGWFHKRFKDSIKYDS